MGVEIERKFLVNDKFSLVYDKKLFKEQYQTTEEVLQGYLSLDPKSITRVRIINDISAVLTVKGKTEGISRFEFEYVIPIDDAKNMLKLCEDKVIFKTRLFLNHDNHFWSIDFFHGENEGLVVAEIELESENEKFSKPFWLSKEVSHDVKYFNSNLVQLPFSKWENEK